jgi:hypothetical protein
MKLEFLGLKNSHLDFFYHQKHIESIAISDTSFVRMKDTSFGTFKKKPAT